MHFQNKTVFITGASRGIGKAIALKLAAEGANIIVAAKSVVENPKLGGTIYTAAEELEAVTMAALGSALREYGIHQANDNADLWWKSCADQAIAYLASTGQPFSADHVDALIPAADHPCRMGGRFHAAVRAGVIQPIGYVLSERPSRHRGVQRQYVGGDAR